MRKSGYKGLLICFFANFIFEVLKSSYGMNDGCYRLLLFRYLFAISFGCFLAVCSERLKRIWYIISFFAGILFLILVCYLQYTPRVFIYWTKTSMLAVLYIVPVFLVCFRKFRTVKCFALEHIGKASYNIFLVQMVYYGYVNKIWQLTGCPRYVHLGINIVICVIFGVIFYYIETPISKRIVKLTDKIIDGFHEREWDEIFLE